MTLYKPPALDKAAPIVGDDGRITPYFQRFWQNLAFTAADGGGAAASVAALEADITSINGSISSLTTSVAGKVAKNGSTGWSAATGTGSKSTFATYSAPTISNPPTQAEVQALANAVQVLSQRMKAVIDGLIITQTFST